MNWSLRLGTILGIPVKVHWTFWILVVWILVSRLVGGAGVGGALASVGLILALFGCVILHEYGHALAARRYGIPTHDITLLPIGGLARLDRMPEDPKQELVVAIAGPLVNVAIVIVLLLAKLLLSGGDLVFAAPDITSGNLLDQLLYVNLALVVFNMLPAFPMDGGRVLRALLAMRQDPVSATQAAAAVGQIMAILFGLLGLLYNPFLLLIAIFVFLGAQGEARQTEVRVLMTGVTVRSAMITDFDVLAPDDPLARASELLINGEQADFPVQDADGRLVGMLARKDLVAALAAHGPGYAVGEAMRATPDPVREDDDLLATHARLQGAACALPVMDSGRLLGIITLENVSEWLMLRAALRTAPDRATDPHD